MNRILLPLILACTFSSVACATASPAADPTAASEQKEEHPREPAGSGRACVPQHGQTRLDFPGLAEGQVVRLKRDLSLDSKNGWLYFAEGALISQTDLAKTLGRSYCAITASEGSASAKKHVVSKADYTLKEISWYVGTVFFTSGQNSFVAYCANVDEMFTSPYVTSAAALAKNLKGVLEPLP